MRPLTILLLLTAICQLTAQDIQPPFTPAHERIDGYQNRLAAKERSLVGQIAFRSIGPTVCSGRVADLDVQASDPTHFYVAYASGGLWKTENNGSSFTPLFDREMVMTIGDIAVDWPRNRIWVGTGEVNSSRSSYAGVGIYLSEDDGQTWEHRGLSESHHIGRIVLHPDDPNTLWVAVLGHLYSPNPERGVYKTIDGGRSWRRVLFVDDNTGAVDLLLDPDHPNTLYAATWERSRRAWDFVESGQGSGIYKSTDEGETWKLLTNPESGFPTGAGIGRIGLDMTGGRLYAILDNYDRRPKDEEEESEGLTKDQLRQMTKTQFLALQEKDLAAYLEQYDFPEEYTADNVREMVEKEEIQPIALVEYVEDANSLLFDTPVVGAEVYVSADGGVSWQKTHEGYLDDLYYSYGYYFGQIRVAPEEPRKLYVLGVPILRSDDWGKTWKPIGGDNVHGDHHALWVDPGRPGHLVLGNDGGVNISYDNGETWIKCNTPAVGQFYAVAVDRADPFRVYGGLQDNGVWVGPSTYREGTRWHSNGHYPYESILGGDGMQVAVDTRQNNIVFTGYQFGNYYRIDQAADKSEYLTPKHKLGERPLRWNWQSPIHLSEHNQDILYLGSNKLHRSFDQGKEFETISEDLTTGGRKGDVAFSTLTTIHESPLKFGLLYTGSDDGLVHLSRDGGNSWQNISAGLPEQMWVARVQASQHELGRVYVALNGYRWDDFTAYLYVSEDFGKTWSRLGNDLPPEPVNVVREDPVNPDLLYTGTDHGLYVSLDRGESFMLMDHKLPAVPVHDLVVHPTAHELVVGTHGRSIYLADIGELQQLTPENLDRSLLTFSIEPVRHSSRWGSIRNSWSDTTETTVALPFYVKERGKVRLSVFAGDELPLKSWEVEATPGLNYPEYDLSIDGNRLREYLQYLNRDQKEGEDPIELEEADNGKYYLAKGKYRVVVNKGEQSEKMELQIK